MGMGGAVYTIKKQTREVHVKIIFVSLVGEKK